ncbi:DUF6962 family protein [Shewanella surugensis]|uniref:GGDEF domain-containing protein n=1 Tax=Shewanella surugensis TaxID=212020 RepID=A0ABT0LLA4_9GAMM|nr:hypothetical protein [Shewanella surugensis]MCL1127941.1 hypothetical protein [Shewanella surugensis]
MSFIDSPIEQMTALTDAMLVILAIASAIYIQRISHKDEWKAKLWVWVFSLLAIASLLGTIVHGLDMPQILYHYLWYPLFVSLSMMIVLFVIATINDIWGEQTSRRILFIMLSIGAACSIVFIWKETFLVFIIYELVGMSFAFAGYLWLAYRGLLKGAGFMAAAVFVTIMAAGIQASQQRLFTSIFSLDHNGVFHLVQMVGVILFVLGLRKALLYENDSSDNKKAE